MVAALTLVGESYSSDSFALAREPATGGIDITTTVPCFARNTLIRTERWEIPVEALRVGDRVVTRAKGLAPVVWIGQRRVDCARHPEPHRVWPVRVRKDAFAAGDPARDLWLSPDHSVFAESVLIPVKYLINSTTIVQERIERTHYFHIELEQHDVLFAEGLAAESYLDTGNRAQFEGGSAHLPLHPDFVPLSPDNACAPLCTGGRVLSAVRRRLVDRLDPLGFVQILADGEPMRLAAARGQMHIYLLPPATRDVRVRSAIRLRIGGVFADGRAIPLESWIVSGDWRPVVAKGCFPRACSWARRVSSCRQPRQGRYGFYWSFTFGGY